MDKNKKDKCFGGIVCDNITDAEYKILRKMKHRKIYGKYKIVITSDRCDYDDIHELANYPERGKRVGTFYFSKPDELDLVVKAFEGLFYQLFKIGETERFDGGVLDSYVYEGWLDIECPQVCEFCFLRNKLIDENWTCISKRK